MKTKVKPIGQRLLIRRLETDEQTEGGIVIPDTAKEKPQEAEILAIGTGTKNEDGKDIPFEVKKGDKVLIPKYGGTEIKVNGEDCVIMKEEDVLALLE
jgi:chaperonin GroES